MEKVIAFVVVRLSSLRLPRKQLRMIGDRRLIDWTIRGIKQSKYVNRIVIATTDEPESKELEEVAAEHGVEVFFYDGDVNDVVGRLNTAASFYNCEVCLLISGDCPLVWAPSLDKLVCKILHDERLDMVGFCLKDGKPPIHEGMSVYRRRCWRLADGLSDTTNLREHHFPIVKLKPELFNVGCVLDDDLFYRVKHRVSVDTVADLEFMNAVYMELRQSGKEFNMPNLVELLIEKPELMNINRDVHQMGLYERQKRALFKVRGLDNLNLLLGMAYELTKKGVGVRFMVRDDKAREMINNRGFGTLDAEVVESEFDILISG